MLFRQGTKVTAFIHIAQKYSNPPDGIDHIRSV